MESRGVTGYSNLFHDKAIMQAIKCCYPLNNDYFLSGMKLFGDIKQLLPGQSKLSKGNCLEKNLYLSIHVTDSSPNPETQRLSQVITWLHQLRVNYICMVWDWLTTPTKNKQNAALVPAYCSCGCSWLMSGPSGKLLINLTKSNWA